MVYGVGTPSFDGRLGKHTNGLEYDWRGDSLAYSTVDGNTGSLHAMQRGYTGWADTPDILNQYEAPSAPAAPEAPAVLAARATDDTCSSSDDDDGAVSFVQHRLPAPPDPEVTYLSVQTWRTPSLAVRATVQVLGIVSLSRRALAHPSTIDSAGKYSSFTKQNTSAGPLSAV